MLDMIQGEYPTCKLMVLFLMILTLFYSMFFYTGVLTLLRVPKDPYYMCQCRRFVYRALPCAWTFTPDQIAFVLLLIFVNFRD